MKMKPEHYTILEQAIRPVLNTYPHIHEDYQLKGLSDMRYRWDLLYISKLKIGDGVGTSGLPLYAYLNDTHIDTALKAITGTK
jgi:hypothetical protein